MLLWCDTFRANSTVWTSLVSDFNIFFSICFREYLATFKKTVAMHEVFLTRLAAHPTLRKDSNFNVFLEFKGEVSEQKN